MGKRVVWIGAWVASFAVFAAGVALLVVERRDRGGAALPSALPELAAMPFPAGLTTLPNPSVHVGDQVVLGVEANSEHGVASISLYDGARRVLTTEADPGRSTTTIRYPALSVGPHALYAAVTDTDGREALSAVHQVDVAAAEVPRPPEADDVTKPSGAKPTEEAAAQPVTVVVEPEPGETASDAADRLGVDPDDVVIDATDTTPTDAGEPVDVADGDPIPAGAMVVVRVPRDHGATETTTPVVTSPKVDEGSIGTGSGLTMSAVADGGSCLVKLSAEGGDGKVAFYEGSSAIAGWATSGRSTGDRTAEVRNLTPGAHVFMARDVKGAQAPPVSVTAPDRCRGGTGWQGTAAIVNGNLLVPPDVAGGRTYLYLRIGPRTFRVPQGQDEYFTSSATTPISTYLPRLEGGALALEVWSDTGGGPFSARAQGTLTVPAGETITSIIGEPSGLRLSARVKGTIPFNAAISLDDSDRELEFGWTSASTRVTEVMWQVLLDDRSSTDHKLAPGDLLASGTSELTDTTGAGTSGRFTLDTAKIPGRDPKLGGGGETVGSNGFTGTQVIHPPYVPGSISAIGAASFATAPTSIDIANVEDPVLTLPTYGDTVYVRVVALTDDVAATNSSSTVPVTLPTPDGVNGKPVDMVITDATYDAGTRANPWLADCVSLTVPWTVRYPRNGKEGGGFNANNLFSGYAYGPDLSWAAMLLANAAPGAPPDGWTKASAQLSWVYPQSRTICPDHPNPDAECAGFFDCLSEAVGELYSLAKSLVSEVVDLYNGAIDLVVQSIVKYSGICQIVGGASGSAKAQSTCKAVMTTVTKAAIGVVLASVGLPVSLPRPDQIEAALQGDLAQVLVAMGDQLGLPCSSLKSADPKDIEAAGDEIGVDTTAAEVAADPCLALAAAMVGGVREQVIDDTSAATAAGKPWPNVVDIPGASLIPSPEGRPTVQTFSVTATVKDANAQLPDEFRCGVRAAVTTPGWKDTWLSADLWLQPTSPDQRTWKATMASNNYLPRGVKTNGKVTGSISPWAPHLILPEGIVLGLSSDGTARAELTARDAMMFGLPTGGIGISRCQAAEPAVRVDEIGVP